MKKILIRLMKNKIIQLIKILGIGINELVIDINLECGSFESIEWDKESDKVWLHIFEDEDIDIDLFLPISSQISLLRSLTR